MYFGILALTSNKISKWLILVPFVVIWRVEMPHLKLKGDAGNCIDLVPYDVFLPYDVWLFSPLSVWFLTWSKDGDMRVDTYVDKSFLNNGTCNVSTLYCICLCTLFLISTMAVNESALFLHECLKTQINVTLVNLSLNAGKHNLRRMQRVYISLYMKSHEL